MTKREAGGVRNRISALKSRVDKKKKLAELQHESRDLQKQFKIFLQVLNEQVPNACKARV